jgi:hypothetical protein
VDGSGQSWLADSYYEDGATYDVGSAVAIADTTDDTLYQSGRSDPNSFSYEFTGLTKGVYFVRLHFAEVQGYLRDQRIFNITANGKLIGGPLDIYARKSAGNAAYTLTFDAVVTEDTLVLVFAKQNGAPMVAGIELMLYSYTGASSTTVGAINATDYQFTLTNGVEVDGDLAVAGAKTVTLVGVCPLGLNGNDVLHYVYISSGVGAAEAVLITGGTALAGVVGGTLQFTTVNVHTGAWTITSASEGIAESAVSLGTNGGTIQLPIGSYDLYATVYLLRTIKLVGCGRKSTLLTYIPVAGAMFAIGDGGGLATPEWGLLQDLSLYGPGTGTTAVGVALGGRGGATYLPAAWVGDYVGMERVDVRNFNIGVRFDYTSFNRLISCTVSGNHISVYSPGLGEGIEFHGSVVANSDIGIQMDGANAGMISFYGGSIDYNLVGITGTGVWINTFGTHYEAGGPFYDCTGASADVNVTGGYMVLVGNGAMAYMNRFEGVGYYKIKFRDIISEVAAAITLTDWLRVVTTTAASSVLVDGLTGLDTGAVITNLYTISGTVQVRLNMPSSTTIGGSPIGTALATYRTAGASDVAIDIKESSHVTSNSTRETHGVWKVGQDTASNGTRNFGVLDGNVAIWALTFDATIPTAHFSDGLTPGSVAFAGLGNYAWTGAILYCTDADTPAAPGAVATSVGDKAGAMVMYIRGAWRAY